MKESPFPMFMMLFVILMALLLLIGLVTTRFTESLTHEEYIGTLEQITYEHSGAFHSISGTKLHFENDVSFRVDGHHVYQLGKVYKITWDNVIQGYYNITRNQKIELLEENN